MSKKIYIIGAGISGLTAAYYLRKKGFEIEIFESTKMAGGRCRAFFDSKLGLQIDNGNHLCLNINKNLLELIQDVNIADNFDFYPSRIRMYDSKQASYFEYKSLVYLPKVLKFNDKIKLIKFLLFFKSNINNLFSKAPALRRKSFISPIEQHLITMGVDINYNTPLTSVRKSNNQINALEFNDKKELIVSDDDLIIFATPHFVTKKLLGENSIELDDNPIVNIHYKYTNLSSNGILGVTNSKYVEWIFMKKDHTSITVSAASDIINESNNDLAEKAWKIVSKTLNAKEALPDFRVIKEKRATFSCDDSNLYKRPDKIKLGKNLYITGDYIKNTLPSSIEGSVFNAKNLVNLIN